MNQIDKSIRFKSCIKKGSESISFFAQTLSQFGIKVNFNNLVQSFKKKTNDYQEGWRISVNFNIIPNKTVDFEVFSPYTSDLVSFFSKDQKKLSPQDIDEIVKIKIKGDNLNTYDVNKVKKSVIATINAMNIIIE